MCRDSDGSQIENIFCAKADYLGERYVFFIRLDNVYKRIFYKWIIY